MTENAARKGEMRKIFKTSTGKFKD